MRDITTVMNEHATKLMARPEVVMVALGEETDGTPCIQIYLKKLSAANQKEIGATIEGHPVCYLQSDQLQPLD
jgi:hypothetical protein